METTTSIRMVCALTVLSAALGGCGKGPEVIPTDTTRTGNDPTCKDAPTWYQDVAPVIGEHCSGCHVAGGIASFRPWTTYAEVQPWAQLIALTLEEQTMPPFIANDADDCEMRFPLLHDKRLPPETIELIAEWAACDAPEGDPANAAVVPGPEVLALDPWDVEVQAEMGYAPTKGEAYVCWALPVPDEWFSGPDDVKWITGVEIIPEDLEVSHHIHAQIHPIEINEPKPDGEYWLCPGAGVWGGIELGGWLPGAPPTEFPEGSAFPLTSTDRVALQVHYHSDDDEPHFDRPKVRFRFGPEPIYEPLMYRVGIATAGVTAGLLPGPNDSGPPEFVIPPGVVGHTETIETVVPGAPGTEFTTFVVSNHMHQVGTSMKLWVEHDPATKAPDEPDTECLLPTPRYDFDWQGFFYYDALAGQGPRIRAGDTVRVQCTYDNSIDNTRWMDALEALGEPREPFEVVVGPTSLDEMCVSLVGALRLED